MYTNTYAYTLAQGQARTHQFLGTMPLNGTRFIYFHVSERAHTRMLPKRVNIASARTRALSAQNHRDVKHTHTHTLAHVCHATPRMYVVYTLRSQGGRVNIQMSATGRTICNMFTNHHRTSIVIIIINRAARSSSPPSLSVGTFSMSRSH